MCQDIWRTGDVMGEREDIWRSRDTMDALEGMIGDAPDLMPAHIPNNPGFQGDNFLPGPPPFPEPK